MKAARGSQRLPETSRSCQKLPEATKTFQRLLELPRTTTLGWEGFYLNLNLDHLIIRNLPTPELWFLECLLSGSKFEYATSSPQPVLETGTCKLKVTEQKMVMTPWDALGRSGTPWDALGRSGTLWDALRRRGTLWDALGRPGTPWDIMELLGTSGSSKPLLEPPL